MDPELLLMLARMDDADFTDLVHASVLTDPIPLRGEAEGVWMHRVRRAYSRKTVGVNGPLWKEMIQDTLTELEELKGQLSAGVHTSIAAAYAIQRARAEAALAWLEEKHRPKKQRTAPAPALIVVADGTPLTRIAPIAPDLRLPDNWFKLVRKIDIDDVLCSVEGVRSRDGGYTPCPMCRTTRRSDKDPRPSVTCGERVWTCWKCKARGDAISFVSAAMGHGMTPTGEAWRQVGAWFVQRFSVDRSPHERQPRNLRRGVALAS